MRTRIDPYTESGGGFPAAYDGRRDHATEARIGISGAMPVPRKSRIIASLESVHRFEKTGASTSGQVIGLFGFNFPGRQLERDWLHASIGFGGPVGPGAVLISVNATTRGQDPNVWITGSYRISF